MLRSQLPLVVGSWKLTVWEANWDQSSMPSKIAEEARKLRASQNGSGDPYLLSFHEVVYPWLAAYTTGEEVPSPSQAFQLSDDDLDLWYLAVRSANAELFEGNLPEPTQVTFRDNSSFTVVSAYLPSSLRKLLILDAQAHQYLEDHPEEVHSFARMKVYAKLACCTRGPIPSYLEIGEWPAMELQKWYEAVLRTNPHLFLSSEDVEELNKQQAVDEEAKKNPPPGKSFPSSKASSKKKARTSQH